MTQEKAPILPPPAWTILSYAVLAWAKKEGIPCRYGLPKMPHRLDWIPAFGRLLNAPDWAEQLHTLALEGFRLTQTPEALELALASAFHWPGFRDLLFDALATYASQPERPTIAWFEASWRESEQRMVHSS